MLSQDALRAHLEARVARVGRAASGPEGAAGAGQAVLGRVGAVAVLRDFDAGTFVASALAFARTLDRRRAAAWYGGFTRTVFLAGDPRNLTGRHPCDHLSPDGDVAWYGPGPPAGYEPLRRMLRPWRGPRGVAVPFTREIPIDGGEAGGGGVARLEVPAAGLSVEDYLVDVNHLVAEAALDGLLDGVGRLVIRHLPGAVPDAVVPPGGHDRVRVVGDPGSPGRLRARAFLSVG